MSALFLQPLAFTAVAGNASSTAPISDAGNEKPGLTWQSANLTTVYAIIDLGTSASYDTVALIGTNLRSTDTVQIRTGTTNTGIGGYAGSAVAAWTGTLPKGLTAKTIISLGSTHTERYMRIDIVSTGNPDGFTSVQRIVVGAAVVALGVDQDAEQMIIDPSVVESDAGGDTITPYAVRIGWKFSVSNISSTTYRNVWLGMLASVGKVQPILFIPSFDDPTTHQADAVYGRIRNSVAPKSPASGNRMIELTIEGLAP